MKNNKVTVAVILGICFLLAAIAVGIFYYQSKKPSKTVSVVGLAEKDFTSDLIVWDLRYDVLDMDMKRSYAMIKDQNKIVKDFLSGKGIKSDEIDFKNISTKPKYESHWENGHWVENFEGYQSEQRIRVESKDVEKIEKRFLNCTIRISRFPAMTRNIITQNFPI